MAELTASCASDGVKFAALITDDNGKPTISFPSLDGDSGAMTVRKNDEKPALFIIQVMDNIRDGFRNRFLIGFIPLRASNDEIRQLSAASPLVIEDNTTWRQMVQIETSAGTIILKIPPFADAIQRVISECK
jgi:hypothetical protein